MKTSSSQDSPNGGISQNTRQELRKGFEEFLESLNEVIHDVTALEVNTIIASDITGTKFVAEEAYQNIFFGLTSSGGILKQSREALQKEFQELQDLQGLGAQKLIPPQFQDDERLSPEEAAERFTRYQRLRAKLLSEYRQIFFDRIFSEEIASPQDKKLSPYLPFPYDIGSRAGYPTNLIFSRDLRDILDNSRFLRSLRKINELKAAADKGDRILAQTVVQLDGDIINRYHQDLFTKADRDLLIKIHHEGVTSGEKQWHGLLDFIVTLVQGILMPSRNGRR